MMGLCRIRVQGACCSPFSAKLLLWVAASVVTITSSAHAAPYFCQFPLVEKLAGHPKLETPHSSPQKEISDLLDPILFHAALSYVNATKTEDSIDFAFLLKKHVLMKAWRELGAKSKKKLLAERKVLSVLQTYELDKVTESVSSFSIFDSTEEFKALLASDAPSIAKQLTSKTLLNFLLDVSHQQSPSLMRALVYVCSNSPNLVLKPPKNSDQLRAIHQDVQKLEEKNLIDFHQLLKEAFPLTPPHSLLSHDVGNFIGQVKALEILFHWSEPGAHPSPNTEFNELRESTLLLSKPYQETISQRVKNFLYVPKLEIRYFLMNSRDSLDHFKSRQKVFMDRLTHTHPIQAKSLSSSLPARDLQSFELFNSEPQLKVQLSDLEESVSWKQVAILMSRNDRTMRNLYRSLFYFQETPLIQEVLGNSAKSEGQSARRKIAPLAWDFSKPSTLEQIFKINDEEIWVFPWFSFQVPKSQKVVWNHYDCQIDSLKETQLKIHCRPTQGYQLDREKTITIANKQETSSLAYFLNRIFQDESQISAYTSLFSEKPSKSVKAFVKILKSQLDKTDDQEEWEDQLELSEKELLETMSSQLEWIQSIQTLVQKYADLAESAGEMFKSKELGNPTPAECLDHLNNILKLMHEDLETNTFSKTTLSESEKLYLWRKSFASLFESVNSKASFQMKTAQGPARMSFQKYVRYLILASLSLEDKKAPPIKQSDAYVLKLDQLAGRLQAFTAKQGSQDKEFTRKYMLHLVSRLGDFFYLRPQSETSAVAKALKAVYVQMVSFHRFLKDNSFESDQQVHLAFEKLSQLQLKVRELKYGILTDVSSQIKELLILGPKKQETGEYQAALERLAKDELEELFYNSNKLSHLMSEAGMRR